MLAHYSALYVLIENIRENHFLSAIVIWSPF